MPEDRLVPHELADSRYLLLTTFRRDGTAVATPVWHVAWGAGLLARSAADSGKVKRLRRSPEATVRPCTREGTPTGLEWRAQVRLMDPGDEPDGYRRLIRRYGWWAPAYDRWWRRRARPVLLQLRVTGPA